MSNQFCVRVGNNIKKYRNEAGMTLKELAEKIGLTEATVQKYEAGNIKNVNAEMVKKMADALGIKPEKITGWDSPEAYQEYREAKQGEEEANLIKMYSQLTRGHKKAVRNLVKSLLECQQKYNDDK